MPERPPSRSERLLRSTLESPGVAHRRRYSHAQEPDTCVAQDMSRAAFLFRTPATAASPVPRYSPAPSRPTSPHLRPASPSPSIRRQSDAGFSLQRHSSIPTRKKPMSLAEPLPLTPHEQVLRARLERVLNESRVVECRERSRERRPHCHTQQDADDGSGWPWSEREQFACTPPKSITSASSDHSHYLSYNHNSKSQSRTRSPGHHRSRSKTDSTPPAPPSTPANLRRRANTSSPSNVKSPYSSPRIACRTLPQRNNAHSSSSGTTPPLTADASPVLGEHPNEEEDEMDPDDVRLITPPPTPPLLGLSTPGSASVKRSGVAMFRTRTGDSEGSSGPYPYKRRDRDLQASVERLDLGLAGLGIGHPSGTTTFNARKASERCRMIEGYVSFANVECLGIPSDGIDDEDEEDEKERQDEKRGRGIAAIGGWAKRLFVGIGSTAITTTTSAASTTTPIPTTTP